MVEVKTPDEIEKIRIAGKIVRKVLNVLSKEAKAGVKTIALNKRAEDIIKSENALPAFKGYKGYPKAICTSVNESVVHEIPSHARVLKCGDIVSFDVGVKYQGFFADAAVTIGIDKITSEAKKLIETTEMALHVGIGEAKLKRRVTDISHAIQGFVEARGFSIVKAFVGHGIGRNLHEDPEIPNFGQADRGHRLKEGMALAIEPMVNAGSYEIKILEDGWTAVTRDRSLSAHFEHTIAVTEGKPDILTI